MTRKRILNAWTVALLAALFATSSLAEGLVANVVKAGISATGNVAGERTDLVINLNVDPDPAVPGFTLLAGHQIRVTLPKQFAFAEADSFPLANIRPGTSCVPGNLQCSTAVLLPAWPQNPVPPGQYTLSLEGNTLVYTANVDIVPNVPAAPAIKQAHMIFNGWRNPSRPGLYRIKVRAQTGKGGAWQRGIGEVRILPRIRPSINVTSVFADMEDPNPPNPNTIYQTTGPGEAAPLQWDFLLWDSNGAPFTGISIEQHGPRFYVLSQNGKIVGSARIDTPPGATGQAIVPMGPSFEIPLTPIVGVTFGPSSPTARLPASFIAGSAAGRYTTTFRMKGGNSVEMVVDVE